MTNGFGVLTVSDGVSHGTREDKSGDKIEEMLRDAGWATSVRSCVPDDHITIATTLRQWASRGDVQCIITTGGTGIAPRDVTPEATLDVVTKQLPGMAEAMRQESLTKTPMAMLSRQVVGVADDTLIVNLPGSPKAVEECLAVVMPVIPHVLDLIAGHTRHEGDTNTST